MGKTDILYVLKVPPPVHGSTMMNQFIADSPLLVNGSNRKALLQSISLDTDDIGNISVMKLWKIFRNYLDLLIALLSNRPKLVYFSISPLGAAFIKDFISILLIKLFKVPLIYHLHGKGIRDASNNKLYDKMYSYSFDGEFVIILSELLEYDISAYNFREIFVIGNGIKDPAGRIEDKGSNGKFTISYLSNFVKQKGVLEFLNVLRVLKEKELEFETNIIGGPFDLSREQVEETLRAYGLSDYVNHFGAAYGDEKHRLLARSDLLIFPTYYRNECYPLVLLEAMSFGLPVITTKEGGIRDIIHDGVNGYIMDPKDIEGMAAKAEILMNDQELFNQMSSNARQKFQENHTIDEFINNVNEVLEQTQQRIEG